VRCRSDEWITLHVGIFQNLDVVVGDLVARRAAEFVQERAPAGRGQRRLVEESGVDEVAEVIEPGNSGYFPTNVTNVS
jgi:hypothetical protein